MPPTTRFQGARLIPNLVYHDADEAIIWLDRAFGFTVLLRVEGEGGRIEHAQFGARRNDDNAVQRAR